MIVKENIMCLDWSLSDSNRIAVRQGKRFQFVSLFLSESYFYCFVIDQLYYDISIWLQQNNFSRRGRIYGSSNPFLLSKNLENKGNLCSTKP